MDASEQIQRFKDFIDERCREEFDEKLRVGENYLIIDFKSLAEFDLELADTVLENPEETLKSAELAVQEFELPKNMNRFYIRFDNLPDNQEILIRDIRNKHIGKFHIIYGVVRQKSDVRPMVTNAKFECPSCGNIIGILQKDKNFREPTRCGCGRKGKFSLLSKELIDAQSLTLEEMPEKLHSGAQPKRMKVLLKEDLVSSYADRNTNPGTKVLINGFVKEVPIMTRTGSKSVTFDLLIEANYIKPVEEGFSDSNLSDEDISKIKELSKHKDIRVKLIDSVAPTIRGYDIVKEALLLQLLGGVRRVNKKGSILRGDMHVFMVGDPGVGKSQLLKRISSIAPKARYVSGKGVSGAGLTATVVKDDFLGGWSLEAGALVLANKGFVMIDEMDKMTHEDRSAMHEALEQQTVSISKANIQATLRAETTVLAAANPKLGRFDSYEMLAKQIDLPITLINRFDLIFPFRDLPDEKKDDDIAGFILSMHCDEEDFESVEEPPIDTETLRKYIAYARQNIRPRLSKEAIQEIKSFYVKLRNSGSDNKKGKAIPISPRQLEALVRIAEACAKIRLSETASVEDARRAIFLLEYCLVNIGIDPETGKVDMDRVFSDTSASQRSGIVEVKKVIDRLTGGRHNFKVPINDVVVEAINKGVPEDKIDEYFDKLSNSGDIIKEKRYIIKT